MRQQRPETAPERLRLAVGAAALALGLTLGLPASVTADPHDPTRSGHPLRIVAYALHPVGVLMDWLIMRPAHWIGHFGPVAALVGHEHPEDDE